MVPPGPRVSVDYFRTACYPTSANYNTGTCIATARQQTSLVYADGDPANAGNRGLMVFRRSSIPDGSTVDSVSLHVWVNDCNTPNFYVTRLTNTTNPVNEDVGDLYADIACNDADGFYQEQTGSLNPGELDFYLDNQADVDIQNCLSQGWFALGFHDVDADAQHYVHLDGWNETNVPYLVLRYRPPTPPPPGPFDLVSPANGATGRRQRSPLPGSRQRTPTTTTSIAARRIRCPKSGASGTRR